MKKRYSTKKLCVTALLLAMNIIMSASTLSVPVPGGHVYLNDFVICTAAILLDPFSAFVVGGIGAFLGDMIFYPTPMFVSLAVHGLQAIIVSEFTHRLFKAKPKLGSVIGVVLGGIITVVGYHLGRAYIYATPAYAILKLPFQIGQEIVGSAAALLLCWSCGIVKVFKRYFPEEG